MSEFNKKNGELDFSNIKQTQLGSGNVMRASFSELQSGLRTLDTNAILKDAYTHFTQILNADDLPTKVEYWQATSPSKYEITCVRDISSNLLDTYIIFEEYISKRTILLYYDVDGNGTAPGIADEEYPVAIIENDSAFVVALSTFTVLKTLSDYFVVRSVGGALYTKVEVQFLQFGETSPINAGTTGFTSTQTKVGTSFKVGEVFIDYNATKDPIYNGNVLKGLTYNAYRAIFESNGESSTAIEASLYSMPFHNLDDNGTVLYIGSSDGIRWLISKLDSGTDLAMTYASEKNNDAYSTYATAWANRLSLTYEILEEL